MKICAALETIGQTGPSNAPVWVQHAVLYVVATFGHLGTGNDISNNERDDEKEPFAGDCERRLGANCGHSTMG